MTVSIVQNYNELKKYTKKFNEIVCLIHVQWSWPCKQRITFLTKLYEKYEGKLKFVRIEAENCKYFVTKHKIIGFPSVLVFSNGKMIGQFDEKVPENELEEKILSLFPYLRKDEPKKEENNTESDKHDPKNDDYGFDDYDDGHRWVDDGSFDYPAEDFQFND